MYASTHCALRNYASESKCPHLEIWLSWNRLFLRNMLFVRSNELWWCRTLSLWFSLSSHNGHSWKGAQTRKGQPTTLYLALESKPTSALTQKGQPTTQHYNIVPRDKTYKSWVTRARVHCRIWQSASTARWANPKFHPNPVQHLASVRGFFGTQFCTWHVQDRGKSVMSIPHNFKTKNSSTKMCMKNVCTWLALPDQERGKARMPLGSGRLSRSMASIIAREV